MLSGRRGRIARILQCGTCAFAPRADAIVRTSVMKRISVLTLTICGLGAGSAGLLSSGDFSLVSVGRTHQSAFQPAFSVAAVLTHEQALGGAHDIELQGHVAFVAGKRGSLAVVNVQNPRSPQLMWFNPDAASLEDAETVLPLGRHLLVGSRDFHSFDIQDPQRPAILKTLSDRTRIDHINGFARRGNVVVAANKEGWIDAFDVTDPAAPRVFGARHVRQQDGLFNPHDIDVVGNYTVTADAEFMGRQNRSGKVGIHRIAADKSDDVLPVERWELVRVVESGDLAGANRIEVHGRHAYVACSIAPDATHLRHGRGVVIDLADPARATQVASIEFFGQRGPNGLTVAGKVWFLAGGQTVDAIDITDPAAPRKLITMRLSNVLPTPLDNAHDLIYRDGYLYVTGQNDHRLVILQIHHPDVLRLAAAR